MKKKRVIILAGAGVAAVAVAAVVASQAKSPPSGQVGSVSIAASATSVSPGSVVTFNGIVKDTGGNGMGGQLVTLYVDGAAVGTFTSNAATSFGPIGYWLIQYTFPAAGTFSVHAAVGLVSSPTVTVTVSTSQVNTFVLAAVTASGTCDIPYTGTASQACAAAQALVGQFEDSIFGGCYHEVVLSVQVYLGPSLVCSF